MVIGASVAEKGVEVRSVGVGVDILSAVKGVCPRTGVLTSPGRQAEPKSPANNTMKKARKNFEEQVMLLFYLFFFMGVQ